MAASRHPDHPEPRPPEPRHAELVARSDDKTPPDGSEGRTNLLAIPQTIIGPNQPLTIPVTSSTIDLTQISSPTLVVQRPDGTLVTWSAIAIVPNPGPPPASSVTATSAAFAYTFVAGDLTTGGSAWLGIWRATPFAVFAGNPVEFAAVPFQVVTEFGTRF